MRIGDTAVAELDETLSPEELKAAQRRDFVSRLPVVDPKSYRITGEAGQGGIGRILRARDERLDRQVALKELLSNAGSVAEDRFVREALLTARLQHPSIVPLYEAGRWPTGEPFYAMKYVSGRSLAEVITEKRTLDQRLGLLPHVLAAAEAMAYAHSERIIHRDLKPANVLVGEFGETVVIDWGLAKDLAEAERVSTSPLGEVAATSAVALEVPDSRGNTPRVPVEALTVHGAVMGTPAYMPLEQATGKRVDERADVYALGAILYHLLAGSCPYDGDSSIGILRKVVAAPPPPIEERQKGIPEDLVAIVRKAMARDPADRYPTAKELADDLRRFQTGQIVGAHKYSTVQLFGRFARRYRAALSVGAAAALVLTVLGAVAFHHNVEARQLAEEGQSKALASQQKAIEHSDDLTLVEARAAAGRDPNEAIAWLKSLSPSFKRWPEARLIAADAASQGIATVLRGHSALINAISFSPDGTRLASVSDDHSARLWDVRTGESRILAAHTDEVWGEGFSPSGRLLATSSKDRTVRVWDVETGALRQTLTGSTEAIPIVLFPDEDTIVSRGDDAIVRIWDLRTGQGRELPGKSALWLNSLSPDRRFVALASEATPLRLYDLKTGETRILSGSPTPIVAVIFSPDGSTLIGRGKDGSLRRWDLTGEKSQIVADPATFTAVPNSMESRLGISPDGKLIALAGEDPVLHLWDMTTGKGRAFMGHQGATMSASFSPDGKLLASGSDDHTVRLWDLDRGDSRVLRGFEDSVRYTAFSPDGKLLAAAGADFHVRLFPAAQTPDDVLLDHASPLGSVAFSPDGSRVLAAGNDGALRLLDRATGARVTLSGHVGAVEEQAFSPAGDLIASASADGSVRVWDLTGHEIWAFPGYYDRKRPEFYGRRTPIAFSPDGRSLAAPDPRDGVVLLDLDAGTREHLAEDGRPATSLTFTPDGKTLLSGGADGGVRAWDLAAKKSRILAHHQHMVLTLAVSPDGKILASGGQDHTLGIWKLETGEGRTIDASGGGIMQVAFSRDGSKLITLGSLESGVRAWDVATGTERQFLRGHAGEVKRFALSPDDEQVATVGVDGTVRLWDLASGQSRVLRGHVGPVFDVAFSPDGRRIASVGMDQTLRLWRDDLPEDGRALRAWIEAATPDMIEMYHRCNDEVACDLPVR